MERNNLSLAQTEIEQCASVLPALAQEATPYLILQIHRKVILSTFWKQ